MPPDKANSRAGAGRLRILLLEDVATDADLELRDLRGAGIEFEATIVQDEAGFRREIVAFSPDVILSDFALPQFTGLQALAIARELRPDIPFVFVSGALGEERAIAALNHGATDYVLKSNLARLPSAVRRAVAEARDKAARAEAESTLAASEERLRTIAEASKEWIWECDAGGRMTYNSPALESILGYSPPEAVRLDTATLIDPDDLPRFRKTLANARAGKAGWSGLVFRWRHRDGTPRWLESNGFPVLGPDGSLLGFRGADRDITERVERGAKLARLSRIRDLTSRVNVAIARLARKDELLAEICRAAAGAGGLRMAWAALVDASGKSLEPVAWEVSDGPLHDTSGLSLADDAPEARSLAVEAYRLNRMVVENDIASASLGARWKEQKLAKGHRSGIAIPLNSRGKTIGVVALFSAQPGYFDAEDQQLFSDLIADVSLAIENIERREQLDYLAYFDALTGLANRTLFLDRLQSETEGARAPTRRLAVAAFNVERMNQINDSFGRAVGDAFLLQLGERLAAQFGATHVARIGMDSFAAFVGGFADAVESGRILAEAIRGVFAKPFRAGAHELQAGAKCGAAVYPDDATRAETLLQNAETALKTAKRQNDPLVFYTRALNADVAQRLSLESRLRRAVEQEQFVLHFQPKVDMETRRIEGLEALIRWNDPETGLVAPARFIGILEDTGLIIEAGRWALRQAAATYAGWLAKGLPAPRIAVNVSAAQLHTGTFVEDVLEAISHTRGTHGVDLEITESMVMADLECNAIRLRRLKDAGLRISIDDFGTGHSSLSYLARLPLDFLKIDRSFVLAMMDRAEEVTVVSAIISLAHSLKFGVIAEGVETEHQFDLLKRLRCDQAQGYLLSRPLPAADIEAMLAS